MKEKIIEAIAKCARERWFLLNLKAKFTGNWCMYVFIIKLRKHYDQYCLQMANIRLSQSISQRSSQLRHLMKKCNAYHSISEANCLS